MTTPHQHLTVTRIIDRTHGQRNWENAPTFLSATREAGIHKAYTMVHQQLQKEKHPALLNPEHHTVMELLNSGREEEAHQHYENSELFDEAHLHVEITCLTMPQNHGSLTVVSIHDRAIPKRDNEHTRVLLATSYPEALKAGYEAMLGALKQENHPALLDVQLQNFMQLFQVDPEKAHALFEHEELYEVTDHHLELFTFQVPGMPLAPTCTTT